MKTPFFWYCPPGIKAKALLPLSFLYKKIGHLRWLFAKPKKVNVPVICIGNIVMGGAGKTPVVIAIADFLKTNGFCPHIISRGYKGLYTGRVNPSLHSFLDVGDEALLLSDHAPTWVGKDRVAMARLAIDAGATHLILDDGFQNPHLHKDLSILIENKHQKQGNGYVFPAGPLRESPEQAFKRAHFIWTPAEQMIGPELTTQPIIAFAGIGYPQKFFQALKDQKFHIVHEYTYPDHHPYTIDDIVFLQNKAKLNGALLATTKKDSMRLPDLNLLIFDVVVELEEELKDAFLSLTQASSFIQN